MYEFERIWSQCGFQFFGTLLKSNFFALFKSVVVTIYFEIEQNAVNMISSESKVGKANVYSDFENNQVSTLERNVSKLVALTVVCHVACLLRIA